MQKALEWFAWWRSGKALWTDAPCAAEDVLSALREALAEQAKQEPVATLGMIHPDWFEEVCEKCNGNSNTPLYAAPVRTKDLTDDEIREIEMSVEPFAIDLARAVIAADRDANK